MDNSVTMIGLAITVLIGIPLIIAFRSNVSSRKKINEIKKTYSKNNHYNFDLTEEQNKKIISLDSKKRGLLFIDFSYKKETIYFVDLNHILLCNKVLTNDSKSKEISKIEIELVHRDSMKKEMIPIYDVENHYLDFNCLYEDHKFAEKWVKAIDDCLA